MENFGGNLTFYLLIPPLENFCKTPPKPPRGDELGHPAHPSHHCPPHSQWEERVEEVMGFNYTEPLIIMRCDLSVGINWHGVTLAILLTLKLTRCKWNHWLFYCSVCYVWTESLFRNNFNKWIEKIAKPIVKWIKAEN